MKLSSRCGEMTLPSPKPEVDLRSVREKSNRSGCNGELQIPELPCVRIPYRFFVGGGNRLLHLQSKRERESKKENR